MTCLTSQISVSEMMHMRDADGLSNKEIASRLGCSITTVYNWIGAENRRKSKAVIEPRVHRIIPGPNRAAEEAPPISYQTQPQPEERHPLVKLKPHVEAELRKRREQEIEKLRPEREIVITKDRRVIDCAGQFYTYIIDTHDSTVTINNGETYTKGQLGLLIRELMRVHGMI